MFAWKSFCMSLKTPLSILKTYYGYEAFRGPQASIIDDVMSGKDVLVLMPTGGGKSLCYQIPAMLRDGVGIIVSPLIALMEDQVALLQAVGIRSAYYNSSQSSKEARQVLAALHQNTIDLLYIAPERLVQASFLERLKTCQVSLFAIDEAHCISQWGHDFRPEYLALSQLKKVFPDVPLMALTATADHQTRRDIIQQLDYDPKSYIASFNRTNIHYAVTLKQQPFQQIHTFIQAQQERSGIIYCGTRATVEKVTEKLQLLGYRARAYHAGLSFEARREVQALFRYDEIDIVVATIAFGMGIDKPNVRFVIHYDLPKNIEGYYQETGRLGRDGMPARALLLYNPADSVRLRSFIHEDLSEIQQRIEHHKLNHMLAFAEATQCRRQILLNYFDEKFDKSCQLCDICDQPPDLIDVTSDAQKFISCVYRLKQRFGMMYVIDVLRGRDSEKILKNGHHRLSTYGIGKDHAIAYWRHLVWHLIHRHICVQDVEQYGVIRLTALAIQLLKGEMTVMLAMQSERTTQHQRRKQTLTALAPTSAVHDCLRSLRRKMADQEEKPAFMIFNDATLAHIASKLPRTMHELSSVHGIGQQKLVRYGEAILNAVAEGLESPSDLHKDALVEE